MAITVTGLKNVNLSALSSLAGDFANASSWFGQGEDGYGSQVTNVVASGTAWSGDGQPDALTTVQTNSSAMAIGQLEMEAASNAMLALHSGMAKAWGKLAVQLDEASRNHVKVHEDGTTEVDSSDLHLSPQDITSTAYGANPRADEYWRRYGIAHDVEMEVKGVLAFAAIADANVKGLLDRIASRVPTSSDSADPQRLAYNQGLADEVVQDLDLSRGMVQFWDAAQPQRMPDPTDPVIMWIKDNASAIGDLILSAGGMLLGGTMVVLGASGDVASFALTITGVGALAGAPGMALSTSVVVAGVGTMGVSAGAMNEAISRMNSSSGGSGSADPVPPNGVPAATKPAASDGKLNNILNDLYKGTNGPNRVGDGTTADAVRAERITGRPTGGKWHFQKAGEYIYSLQKWLAEHPGASAADKAVANQEIAGLQNSLGPRSNW